MKMNRQKQVNEGGNATLSVKVTQETYDLLNILAEGLQHGTNANNLLKMFVHAFIESAKHTGPISHDMRIMLDLLKVETDWHNAFNFADVESRKQIAKMVLLLEQPGKKGLGIVMINKPFIGKSTQTYCVDDILECVVQFTMKGLYQELRDIGNTLGTESMRETLFTLCDVFKLKQLDEDLQEEGPQMGNHTDFGRAIHDYGNPSKRKKHVSPDDIQTHIVFDENDREAADVEAQQSKDQTDND